MCSPPPLHFSRLFKRRCLLRSVFTDRECRQGTLEMPNEYKEELSFSLLGDFGHSLTMGVRLWIRAWACIWNVLAMNISEQLQWFYISHVIKLCIVVIPKWCAGQNQLWEGNQLEATLTSAASLLAQFVGACFKVRMSERTSGHALTSSDLYWAQKRHLPPRNCFQDILFFFLPVFFFFNLRVSLSRGFWIWTWAIAVMCKRFFLWSRASMHRSHDEDPMENMGGNLIHMSSWVRE